MTLKAPTEKVNVGTKAMPAGRHDKMMQHEIHPHHKHVLHHVANALHGHDHYKAAHKQ